MAPTRAALGWGNPSYTTRSWLQDLMANTGVNSAAQLTSGSHGWGSEWSVAKKQRSLVFTPLDAFGLAKLASEVSGAPSTGRPWEATATAPATRSGPWPPPGDSASTPSARSSRRVRRPPQPGRAARGPWPARQTASGTCSRGTRRHFPGACRGIESVSSRYGNTPPTHL